MFGNQLKQSKFLENVKRKLCVGKGYIKIEIQLSTKVKNNMKLSDEYFA